MRRPLFGALLVLAACTTEPTVPVGEGAVHVTVQVTGGGIPDTNGYTIDVGNWHAPVSPTGGGWVLTDIPAGRQTVRLGSVASWCTSTPASRSVDVKANDTVEVAFSVSCSEIPWPVTVVIKTVGIDQDPDGYLLKLGGSSTPVGTQDSVSIVLPTGGDVTLALEGVRSRCWTDRAFPVTYRRGVDPTKLTLTVGCGVLATTVFSFDGTSITFGLLNMGTGEFRSLPTRQGWTPSQVSWSADATKLYIGYGDNTAYVLDLAAASLQHFAGSADTNITALEPVPDGGFLVGAWIGDSLPQLYRWPGPGASLSKIPGAWLYEIQPSHSPTRNEIAYFGFDTGSMALSLMDGDGGHRRKLVAPLLEEDRPVWTPDGEQIVFVDQVAVGAIETAIHLIHRDGTGLILLTSSEEGAMQRFLTVSRDGGTVIYENSTVAPDWGLRRLPIGGGTSRPVTTPAGTPFGASAFMP